MTNKITYGHFGFCLVILISGLFSCKSNSDTEEVHILKSSIGFDDIELSELTLSDLRDKFGNNYTTDTFYVQPIFTPSSVDSISIDKKEIFSFRFYFGSLGISFYFKPDSNEVTALRVERPFKGQTEKGIVLNKSTFREIIKTYGDSAWEFTGDYISRSYKGIRFYRQFHHDMLVPDSILAKYLDSTVTEISVSNVTGQ
jgi:hypothetical protein